MLLETLHAQVTETLHRQLLAIGAMTSSIRAAETLEARLRQQGLQAAAAGLVGPWGASVHVVVHGDPRAVAKALAEHGFPFERDLARDDGLSHPFTVHLEGSEVFLLALHPTFEQVTS